MVVTLASATGRSMRQVAEEVGIHRNRLSDKVNGKLRFTEQEIVRLATFFGVEPGLLFRDPKSLLGVGSGPAASSTTGSLPIPAFREEPCSEATNPRAVIRPAGLSVDIRQAA